MSQPPETPPLPEDNVDGETHCRSCGGGGMCPGIAILFGYIVGSVTTVITDIGWLGVSVGIGVTLTLITGAGLRILGGKKS